MALIAHERRCREPAKGWASYPVESLGERLRSSPRAVVGIEYSGQEVSLGAGLKRGDAHVETGRQQDQDATQAANGQQGAQEELGSSRRDESGRDWPSVRWVPCCR